MIFTKSSFPSYNLRIVSIKNTLVVKETALSVTTALQKTPRTSRFTSEFKMDERDKVRVEGPGFKLFKSM